MQYGLRPVGTIAHEWIMAMGAKENYELPNIRAMDAWEKGESRVPSFCMSLKPPQSIPPMAPARSIQC